jgi:acyl-ACP thioesterase
MNSYTEHDLTLYRKYVVSSADTDMFARLRPGALINMLIQSAIDSADALGFGFNNLKQKQLFWVLSRFTLEVYSPVFWNQLLEVETWPKTVDGLLYLRDFKVTHKNQIVAKATSGWLAVDSSIRKPKHIEGLEAEMFVQLHEKHAIEALPEKLPGTESSETFDIITTYFDFDLNQHVTTTRYIDWMLDTFDPTFHKHNIINKLSVNFMRETMPGDKLVLHRRKVSERDFSFEGINVRLGNTSFRGKLSFIKK